MNPIRIPSSSIARLRTALLTVAGAALLALPAGKALAQTASSLKLQVNGMVCSFCAQGIEKRLKSLPDTGAIFIDLRNNVVAVEPRAGQTLDAQRVATEPAVVAPAVPAAPGALANGVDAANDAPGG
jgi:copper chaperone CopZ